MCDVVRRIFVCMNKAQEEKKNISTNSKRSIAGTRHIRKRQPAKPNTYIRDTSFTSSANESNNSNTSTRSSIVRIEREENTGETVNHFPSLRSLAIANSRPSSMGKVDMRAFNEHTFNLMGISAKSNSSLASKRSSDLLRHASSMSIKEESNHPSREETINMLLSCNPAQRYSGSSPLIPTPKGKSPGVQAKPCITESHVYNNTKYPHKNFSDESPIERENGWGWVCIGKTNLQTKKQRLHNQQQEVNAKMMTDAQGREDNVVETFVSPGGTKISIKLTEEDNSTFKTEYWRHLVALLGGGNVTFAVRKKTDFLTSWKSMQLLKEERKMNMNNHQEENQFNLTKRAYQKLINYCRANKMTLHEELPAYCKNRARKSTKAVAHESDFKRLVRVLETVEECSWYWGNLSGNDARRVLNNSPPGTFLLRDSSDPRYLYSLSIKTSQGPTSIRIVYKDNSFQFDSDMDQRPSSCRNTQSSEASSKAGHPNYVAKRKAPVFECVVSMVLRYTKHIAAKRTIEQSKHNTQVTNPAPEQFMCYWMNRTGRQEIPVILAKPKNKGILSLQDQCRITLSKKLELWKNKEKIECLPLPGIMKKYIQMYPYPA